MIHCDDLFVCLKLRIGVNSVAHYLTRYCCKLYFTDWMAAKRETYKKHKQTTKVTYAKSYWLCLERFGLNEVMQNNLAAVTYFVPAGVQVSQLWLLVELHYTLLMMRGAGHAHVTDAFWNSNLLHWPDNFGRTNRKFLCRCCSLSLRTKIRITAS